MESFSWIEESERMCSIESNLLREKLSSIPMMFIYINKHKVIDSIDTEILLLPDSLIPKEKLIKLIKSKEKNTPVRIFAVSYSVRTGAYFLFYPFD